MRLTLAVLSSSQRVSGVVPLLIHRVWRIPIGSPCPGRPDGRRRPPWIRAWAEVQTPDWARVFLVYAYEVHHRHPKQDQVQIENQSFDLDAKDQGPRTKELSPEHIIVCVPIQAW
ncbi:hypothetical protein KQX54_020806 [Cotesia glomerata]|uniref:Uncharacterized protein n=1 Tax=Cotesia glomerata TaxID=32391 RepID=A0AAV7I1H3_COTGL|nr:hypothetical protein KQX54_020806 [Cotesia glomerata]